MQVEDQIKAAPVGEVRAAFEAWWEKVPRPTDPKMAAWQAWLEQGHQ